MTKKTPGYNPMWYIPNCTGLEPHVHHQSMPLIHLYIPICNADPEHLPATGFTPSSPQPRSLTLIPTQVIHLPLPTMKTSTFLLVASLAAPSSAIPMMNTTVRFNVASEDASNVGSSDYSVLQFALTLEHLEAAFYSEVAAKFSAADFSSFNIPDLYTDVLRLARDEAVHVDVLTSTLRSLQKPAPSPCKYTFPYTSAASFLALAAVIEGVGVSAYAGASTSLRDPAVLSMAAGILSVEARHDAILRAASGIAPYASPFDAPLDFNQAWTLASQFIVPGSCPDDYAPFHLTTFPKLALTGPSTGAPLQAGQSITLTASADEPLEKKRHAQLHRRHGAGGARARRHAAHVHDRRIDGNVYAAFLTVQGAVLVEAVQNGDSVSTTVPDGVAGQVYVLLVRGDGGVTDANTLAGPAVLEVADAVGSGATEDEGEGIVERC